jgi:hypothetical protein
MLSKLMEIYVMFILHSGKLERGSNLRAARGWFAAGKSLRLAADLNAGAMRLAVVKTDGTSAGGEKSTSILSSPMAHIPLVADWQTAYSSGLQPSATVGAALFPAISGKGGAKLRCKFGLDARFPQSSSPAAEPLHKQVLFASDLYRSATLKSKPEPPGAQ